MQPFSAIGFSFDWQENPQHARASQTANFAENTTVAIAIAGLRGIGDVLDFAGRHARPVEIHASRRLLLSLFAREDPGKLRENV